MTSASRRQALWALANIHPGDPKASQLFTIRDGLDDQERYSASFKDKPLELDEVRDRLQKGTLSLN